ncbi:MAG: hypothetical protein AAFN93_13290 [Bacteroidota bacterium]
MDSAGWLNDEHVIWALPMGLIIFILLFVREWYRKEKKGLLLRLLASALLTLSIILLYLKPVYRSTVSSKKAIILTEGYKKSQLDSIQSLVPKADVLNYTDTTSVDRIMSEYDSLILLGAGIPSYDLFKWNNVRAAFMPSRTDQGIIDFKYKDKITVSEVFEITLKYRGNGQYHKIVLNGLGAPLDSAEINFKGDEIIRLSTDRLVSQGKFLLNVVVRDSLDNIVENDILPISVTARRKLKVLIVNQFPTFDTKYLKNYLSSLGYMVTVRSKVSKDKFRYEYYNTTQNKNVLSENTLKDTDLLVIDYEAYQRTSKREKSIIRKAIQEFGMGVFIQPSEGLFISNNLDFIEFRRGGQKETELLIDRKKFKLPSYEVEIISARNNQSVLEVNNNSMVSYQRDGLGRIGTALFYDSYRLVLEGESIAFNKLWAKIVNGLGKRPAGLIDVSLKPGKLTTIQQPLNAEMTSSDHTNLYIEDSEIPLIQDINLPDHWVGSYWPIKTGWHNIRVGDSLNYETFYVHHESSWYTMRLYQRSLINKRFFNLSNEEKPTLAMAKKQINPLWFLLLFLVSAGYLWLEPKM